jgi:hypothetical protein
MKFPYRDYRLMVAGEGVLLASEMDSLWIIRDADVKPALRDLSGVLTECIGD